MKKLNFEQSDNLDALIVSEGFPVLLSVIEDLCAKIDQDVLSFNLNRGSQELLIIKARSEGARSLQRELTAWCEGFKQKGNKASQAKK